MVQNAAPIDFTLLEPHKENIQSLPSGRSASHLARLYSPPLTAHPSPPLSSALKSERAAFEAEIAALDEADDPLDVYVRYAAWTSASYPSDAAKSGLVPLLEDGTRRFLGNAEYKNDVRYLKFWLQYAGLHDAPREVYVFISRHGVGAELALFYEEYAAWLEVQGRWSQAAEVYEAGVQRGARPVERLSRKRREFEARREQVGEVGVRPDSPALPVVRKVLGEKVGVEGRQQGEEKEKKVGRKGKMEVFKEETPKESVLGSGEGTWDGLGTLQGRKKENVREASAWDGQTLKVGKTNAGVEKLQIFRSSSSVEPRAEVKRQTNTAQHEDQTSINPRNGRRERVFVNLMAIYPIVAPEQSFEEAMARHRGWLEKDWARERSAKSQQHPRAPSQSPEKKPKKKGGFEIFHDSPDAVPTSPAAKGLSQQDQENVPIRLGTLNDENNENAISRTVRSKEEEVAKRMRREERANRTRKIKMTEVRLERKESQTIQLNLASPTGPKIKRKKAGAEPTMTINTKEAMEEIYGMFDAPVPEKEEEEEEAESSDDDYTSGGESTTTGHISATGSEYGDETRREILNAQVKDLPIESQATTETEAADTDGRTEVTGWSDFTVSKHVPHDAGEDDGASEADSESEVDNETSGSVAKLAKLQIFQDECPPAVHTADEDLITPLEEEPIPPETMYIPLPPEDYEFSNGTYRDRAAMANNRLPFMTPIPEQTESSIGTSRSEKKMDYFGAKTPSRLPQGLIAEPILEDDADVGDELMSSPFQEQVMEAVKGKKEFIQQTKLRPIGPTALVKTLSTDVSKGPIISEQQVNPCDPVVREFILQQMRPALASYYGFHNHRDQDYARIVEIKRYAATISKKGSKADKNGSTLSLPPTLSFDGTDSTYTLKRELGAGAFAPVYLVDHHPHDSDRGALEAMKMETPSSAWEYLMIHLTHRRLAPSRATQSIIRAHECHLFRDASFLLEDYADTGTLLDVVNVARNLEGCHGGAGAGLEEGLAMFFTVELLRVVEGMHARGLIHGDLKADNVMLRLPSDDGLEGRYRADGAGGWDGHGVTLIDFGRGIDMKCFGPDVKFEADWVTSEADCVEMRELRTWTYQVDYHGLAGTIHTLLFGKYMSVVPDHTGGGDRGIGGARRWKCREALKRYWQHQLWGGLFGMLLNSAHPDSVALEDGQKMPLLKGLRGAREEMERWLESVEGGGRDGGLKGRLRRIEEAVVMARKAKR